MSVRQLGPLLTLSISTWTSSRLSYCPAITHTATPTQRFRNLQQKGEGHWWVRKKLSCRNMFEYNIITIGSLNLIWHVKIQSLPQRKYCGLIAVTKQLMLFREIVLCLLWLISLAYSLCFMISSGAKGTAVYITSSTAEGQNALNSVHAMCLQVVNKHNSVLPSNPLSIPRIPVFSSKYSLSIQGRNFSTNSQNSGF